MKWGIKEDVQDWEYGKRRREVKKRERCFTLLPSLLHPVLIDTEALKKMSVQTRSVCVCLCVHSYTAYTVLKKLYLWNHCHVANFDTNVRNNVENE